MDDSLQQPEFVSVDDLYELVQGFKNPTYEVRLQTAERLRQLGIDHVCAVLVEGLNAPDEVGLAMSTLRELGRDAAPAAPGVVDVLMGDRTNLDVYAYGLTQLLGEMGPAAVPGLLRLLEHPDPEIRLDYELARDFITISPPAAEIVPLILKVREKLGDEKNSPIPYILAHYGAAPEITVPMLVADLEYLRLEGDLSDIDVDLEGAFLIVIAAMGPYGASAAAAVPILSDLLNVTNLRVASSAATTLGEIGPAAELALPRLETILQTPFQEFLRERHPEKDFDKTVKILLAKGYEYFRIAIAEALWNITSDASRSVDHLIRFVDELGRDELFDHYDVDVALNTLARIGPVTKDVIPAIIHAFEAGKGGLNALAEIGPAAQEALPTLRRGMSETYIGDRLAYSWAIYKIEGDLDVVISVLIEALDRPIKSGWSHWHQVAILRLAAIGPPAQAAIPALQRALVAESPTIRSMAARAIEAITLREV